jgi:NAD(P)H dehydrogenase (quinone)
MKIAIVYFSKTGNTEKAALLIRDGILRAGEFEVRLMNIGEEGRVDAEFLTESSAVILGTPTYVANMAWQLKKWFDTERNVKLAGKLGAAFATANFVHGGPDLAIADILHHCLVKGMVVYSSGAGCGAPFIHLGPVAVTGEEVQSRDLFITFGKRIAEKALQLFGPKP